MQSHSRRWLAVGSVVLLFSASCSSKGASRGGTGHPEGGPETGGRNATGGVANGAGSAATGASAVIAPSAGRDAGGELGGAGFGGGSESAGGAGPASGNGAGGTAATGGTAVGTGGAGPTGGRWALGGTEPGGSTGGPVATGGGGSTVRGTLYLSDLCDEDQANGWGPVERDLSNGEEEARDGGPLIINGQAFSKGLGTHAPAEMSFSLGGQCTEFLAEVGIDEEMKGNGSVTFQVWGDAVMLEETSVVTGWQGPLPLAVDITGVQSLRLVVDANGANGSDHADWGAARVVCGDLVVRDCAPSDSPPPTPSGWHLAWSDEFDVEGLPNPADWDYESGMVRNEEWQYYTDQNASVVGGFLVIQGRRESYEGADYTSSSLRTVRYSPWAELHTFEYGRFEMRARVVAEPGLWPAFWTLGTGLGNWPFNGEIDIMEYYDHRVHANVASSNSTDQNAYSAQWDGSSRLISDFGVADWDAKFHVWRMDWDSERIVLSVDDYVMNDVPIDSMLNADGTNPFAQKHYILVNLAIGGTAGGDASDTHFPVHYVVDYVRVYQED